MEKLQEFMVNDLGEVTVAMRPMLPFLAERCRLRDARLDIHGEGRKIALPVPDHAERALEEVDEILLLEFSQDGSHPTRELLLSVVRS